MKKLALLILICLNFSLIAQTKKAEEPKIIKLLVVTGGPTLRHQIDLVPTSFYTLFTGYDNLIWDHAAQDEAAFQSDRLFDYDVILMYNRSDSLSEKSQQNLKKYLNSGNGLIVLHHALGSYNNWEWWWNKVVGGRYQMIDENGNTKSDYKLEETISMEVEKQHFINESIGDFEFEDETYKNLWFSKEIDIIYKTKNPTSDGPTVWVSLFDKSKVVVIQPGHAKSAHLDLNYKNLIYRAILWTSY